MSYAMVQDVRKAFKKALSEERYHIIITVEDAGGLLSLTYGHGIVDEDVIINLTKEAP